MKECAKICVKKCKRAKNWKIDFADVCIFFFDGSFICRCLYIFRPSSVPRHSIRPLQLEAYTLIINDLYL